MDVVLGKFVRNIEIKVVDVVLTAYSFYKIFKAQRWGFEMK
jgi:hypothetical protein